MMCLLPITHPLASIRRLTQESLLFNILCLSREFQWVYVNRYLRTICVVDARYPGSPSCVERQSLLF